MPAPQGCGCWLSKVVRCSRVCPSPVLLTHTHPVDAGNLCIIFVVHFSHTHAACQALLKVIYVLWSLLLPSLPSSNGKSIRVSLRGYSLKKIAGDSGSVTQLTSFHRATGISSTGDDPQCYFTVNSGRPHADLPSFHPIVSLSLADLVSALIN